jgi:hypothetical protein
LPCHAQTTFGTYYAGLDYQTTSNKYQIFLPNHDG